MEPLPLYVENDAPVYVEVEEPLSELDILLSSLRTHNNEALDPVLVALIMSENTAEKSALVGSEAPAETDAAEPDAAEPDSAETDASEADVAETDSACLSLSEPWGESEGLEHARLIIATRFFEAIANSQGDRIALFLTHGLVTASTTYDDKTPLLRAVETKNMKIVEQLIAAGAKPDEYGVVAKEWYRGRPGVTQRTPLQLAASIGNLPLVKLLMEVHHCDDASIAPDGQIALRLASAGGHREVVDYLPSRRGGGWMRWKTSHKKAIRRCTRAIQGIFVFGKFFLWDIEKFFLWTIPKHLIFKPLAEFFDFCRKNRRSFGSWCTRQVKETPTRCKRFGKWVWKGIKKIPKATADMSREIWEFLTVDVPRALKKFAKWLRKFVTKSIPKASAIAAKWIWSLISATGRYIWSIVTKSASIIHSVLSYIVNFLGSLTLKDIWAAVVDLLDTIFLGFPKIVWAWLQRFGKTLYKVLVALFGCFGQCIFFLGWALVWIVTFVPRKLWVILKSAAQSVGNGGHEIRVFFSPKA